jgi:hypothetical protein
MLLRGREALIVKQAQKEGQSARRTHWAAQFAVASELCKRGYEVALTMGNYPVIDLMVVSPKGVPFLIYVNAQYKKIIWPVRRKKARGRLFYVLAFVPDVGQNRFFILTQEAVEKIRRDLQHAIAQGKARGLDGKPLSLPIVEWDFAKKHEGAWKVLPE